MSRNGGQASGTALRADCNVIWLAGAARADRAEAQTRCAANIPIPSVTYSSVLPWIAYAAGITACMAGQAAALPVLAAAGAWGDPWIVSAVFGMAAAIASWAGARIAGNFREATGSASRVPPQDLALYDAFTLALIVAASADLGLGAALLLPAGAVLALAIRRMAKSRAADEKNAMLLLMVAIAMAGLCGPLGFRECITAGMALAAVAVMKAGHGSFRLRGQQMWHVWGASALLCATIAATRQGPAALPAALGLPLALPFVAGAIYGAAAGVSSRLLSGWKAKALPVAVPFLSVAAASALGGPAHLPQIAAAVLLAAAVAGSRPFPARPREPAVSAPNAWPMGWL